MANTTTRKNHYEIISRLEKELNDLKGLSEAYVRLMGKDDTSLQIRIETTKSHYSLLKKYQDKYLQLISYSDIQLRIFNSNERIKIKDDDELSTISDEKIKDKIKSRTWSENEYWSSIFLTNNDVKIPSKKEEIKKPAPQALNYLSNQEAAEAYFSAAIYEHDYSNAKEGQYIKKKKNIARATLNLHEFYEQNGSLSNLPVDGIDSQSRRVLELVFKNGLDKAKEILNNERQDKLDYEKEEPAPVSSSSKGSKSSGDNDIIEINLTEFEQLEVLNEYDLFALNLKTNIKVTIISIDDINLEAVGINYKAKNESKTYKIVVKEY